jgi:hypothetical protein
MYELPEHGTDLSKHVGLVKDHTFIYVCNLWIEFVFINDFSSSSSSMALQPGVGQRLLLLGFHPEGFLVGKCAFCSE